MTTYAPSTPTRPSAEGLLSCPFCGGAPAFRVGEHSFNDVFVSCTKCGVESALFDDEEANSVPFNKDGARLLWNTRHPSPTPPTSTWQDIASAPRDGTEIIVFRPKFDGQYIPRIGLDYYKTAWMHSREDCQPTHWQPLPPPPAVKDGG